MRWGKPTDDRRQITDNRPGLQSHGDAPQSHGDAPQSAVCNLKSEIRCPLCGKQFRAGDAMPCATCALAARCGLVMCPNCSYEFAV